MLWRRHSKSRTRDCEKGSWPGIGRRAAPSARALFLPGQRGSRNRTGLASRPSRLEDRETLGSDALEVPSIQSQEGLGARSERDLCNEEGTLRGKSQRLGHPGENRVRFDKSVVRHYRRSFCESSAHCVKRSFVLRMPGLDGSHQYTGIECRPAHRARSSRSSRIRCRTSSTSSAVTGGTGSLGIATATPPRISIRTSNGAGSISTRPSWKRTSSGISGLSPAASRIGLGITRRPAASMELRVAVLMAEIVPDSP